MQPRPSTPLLALDIGTKRTGIALNPTGSVILELPTISYGSTEDFLVRIAEVLTEHQPQALIVGRPRQDDGPIPTLFEQLKQLPGCPSIHVVDEALTTKEAERQMASEGVSGDSDARAARLILQQYLTENHE